MGGTGAANCQLRTDDFTAFREEGAAWHGLEAARSEHEGQWFAAAFHIGKLLALRPGDNSLTERLSRARERLQRDR